MPKYLFYDQDIINELKSKINELNNQIKMYSNKTSQEYAFAKKEVENKNKAKLDEHNNTAVKYYEIILKLKAQLEILLRELAEAEAAPRLNAEKARIAAAEANNISNQISKIKVKRGGNQNVYDPNLIIELKANIEKLSNQIKVLSNKTSNEYNNAKKEVINKNANKLNTHNNQAVEYYQEILRLKAELDLLLRRLKEAESAKHETSDEGLALNGPGLYPGVKDPKNKFVEGDYVVATGSSKPEKQKFIGKTGKIETVLDAGEGLNTSIVTRYDINFGDYGSANFKESRLKMGNVNDYKSTRIIRGESFYDKYLKYRNKYISLKQIKGGDINDLQLKNKDNHIAELNQKIKELQLLYNSEKIKSEYLNKIINDNNDKNKINENNINKLKNDVLLKKTNIEMLSIANIKFKEDLQRLNKEIENLKIEKNNLIKEKNNLKVGTS